MLKFIDIKGAREHNLKDIDVKIPKNALVVLTGLSGSGKSSLAFDTIYAEGQRRYVESLSAYARQFLGVMEKPEVDHIDGLSPAISIDQKSASHNPRSTVGTITEIYDYLRLMYARIGTPTSPVSGEPLTAQTIDQMVDRIQKSKLDKLMVLAPVVIGKKGEHREVLAEAEREGYSRIRIDGEVYEFENDIPAIDKNKRHNIEIVVDRLTRSEGAFPVSRLSDSLEKALKRTDGYAIAASSDSDEQLFFSEKLFDPATGMSFPKLEPRLFSFNSPQGACPTCGGLGHLKAIDPAKIIPNTRLSIAEGAIRPWAQATASPTLLLRILEAVARQHRFSLNTRVEDLKPEQMHTVLYGIPEDETVDVRHRRASGTPFSYETHYEGVIPNLERRYHDTDSDFIRREIERFMVQQVCPECHGERLRKEALAVLVAGRSIAELSKMPVRDLKDFFAGLKLTATQTRIAVQILREVKERIDFLLHVGLPYLTLNRTANTLSGGEAQRVRLATQIGSGLSGVIYILDEPSIGLHQHNNRQLIKTLESLRDLGNTVLVVEHDEEMIRMADYLIDLGPGAGKKGGHIVAQGTPAQVAKSPKSITGQYLSGKRAIEVPKKRREGNGKSITVHGASANNLQNIDVNFPLGEFVAVTGLSGSGKSSLVNEILAKELAHHLHRAGERGAAHKDIKGIEHLDKVIVIDQSPIGRTPRSNPATYTGIFGPIRDIFSELPEAKMRGFKPGRFSFNVKGGRCEHCQGDGVIKIEMHFLPDIYVPCEVCGGKRYNRETLLVEYKEKNISDVLRMTVDEARDFFENIPTLRTKLSTLQEVGLGYVELGQNATELSGGEAQRIKLATELSRRATGQTLYILDEPTTGLHFEDIRNLLSVLHTLVDKGNTVLVIEHNLDVIKTADWVIDLGPEGGNLGGEIVAEGTPEQVAKVKRSFTGQYLKELLSSKKS